MASIIPDYNYDIFISYRQKDNKHEGWVTEFVDNLKGELESTFKEEISVYFDNNPQDGLLETHDVDESLKEKLNCLIFIPIISRTYCDPKSFAWENEFRAFLDQASGDQFGLKVKLPGGNVTSRVLPVQIHELDTDDKKLVENELGGHIRGIEFIYKEPGVNRPLTPKDTEDKNTNKANYRNQINKVANAIKEIITGMRNSGVEGKEAIKSAYEEKPENRKNQKTKIVAGSVIALILIIMSYLFIPKLFNPAGKLEKSIAILPFINDSPDTSNIYFINGLREEVIVNLQSINEFRVLSRTSTDQYKGPDRPSANEIARKLGVNYIIEGSGQKSGNKFRLRVQLINAKGKETHLWAKSYEKELKESTNDYFNIHVQIAQAIASELKAVITPEEKQLIEKTPTSSLDALYFYQKGTEEHSKYSQNNREALGKAKILYNKALEYDSTFARAYLGLARVYWTKHYWGEYFSQNFMDSVRILTDIALSFDDQLADAYSLKGEYYRAVGDREEAINEYDKAIRFNPNDWISYRGKGLLYQNDDFVIQIDNLQKAASRTYGRELPGLYKNLSWAYISIGFKDKSIQYFQDALKLDGDSLGYYLRLVQVELSYDNFEEALDFAKKAYKINPDNIDALNSLGALNMYLGRNEEALKYYKDWHERLKATGNLDTDDMHRIGYVYWINGYEKEADYYFDKQIEYCTKSIELSRLSARRYMVYYNLAGVHAFRGEKDKAYENLRIFNHKIGMPLWMVILIKIDPLFDNIRNEPEFQQIVRDVESKYQSEHKRVRKWLEDNNML